MRFDFLSREPGELESLWGAVACPHEDGYRLRTPLEVLSARSPEALFGTPERAAAGEARARALLLRRAEGEKDVGGG